MEKRGRVEEGRTPSVVSGKPADHVNRRGEPLAPGEKVATVRVNPPASKLDTKREGR